VDLHIIYIPVESNALADNWKYNRK